MEFWVFTTVLFVFFSSIPKFQSFLLEKRPCRATTYAFTNDLLWCRSIPSAFFLTFPHKFFHVQSNGTLKQNWRKPQTFTSTGAHCRELNLITRALSDVLVQQEGEIYYHLHPQLWPHGPCSSPTAAVQERPLATESGSSPTPAETRFPFPKTKLHKQFYKGPIVLQKLVYCASYCFYGFSWYDNKWQSRRPLGQVDKKKRYIISML